MAEYGAFVDWLMGPSQHFVANVLTTIDGNTAVSES